MHETMWHPLPDGETPGTDVDDESFDRALIGMYYLG
jgi:hypothetical protein